MPSVLKRVRNVMEDAQAAWELSKGEESLPYKSEVLERPEDILAARKMLADVYTAKGVVAPDQLAEDGTLNSEYDPYQHHAVYYGVRDKRDPSGDLIMSARVILTEGDINNLQIHLADLDDESRAELMQQDPNGVAELASYVKKPGLDSVESRVASLFLMRQILGDAREVGIKTMVFGLRKEIVPKYQRIFGPVLDRMGQSVHLGKFAKDSFQPYKIDIESAYERFVKQRKLSIGGRAISGFMRSTFVEQDRRRSAAASIGSVASTRVKHV